MVSKAQRIHSEVRFKNSHSQRSNCSWYRTVHKEVSQCPRIYFAAPTHFETGSETGLHEHDEMSVELCVFAAFDRAAQAAHIELWQFDH